MRFQTIQQVIDMALAATPYDPALDTVDTVKTGDPHQPVKASSQRFWQAMMCVFGNVLG